MGKVKSLVLADEVVMSKIYLVRNHKVMLDMDLAELYGVETKHLKRAPLARKLLPCSRILHKVSYLRDYVGAVKGKGRCKQ